MKKSCIYPYFLPAMMLLSCLILPAQDRLPKDYLSAEFHKERREALREKLPANSVAVFFSAAERNRANDVNYVYHQDPDFYYLTGFKEPHSVLVIFSEKRQCPDGSICDEILYTQNRSPVMERWLGPRLGVEGAKEKLGFSSAENASDFKNSGIDFNSFSTVFYKEFKNDVRDNTNNPMDLFDLIRSFRSQLGIDIGTAISMKEESRTDLPRQKRKIDNKRIMTYLAELRQIKTPEELKLLTKAIRISAQGQIEVMKAMKPNMSETEIQGIHEYVYKKYGSEYEGYPSIVGAGNNGCVLHYIENAKTSVEGELVLMDLGAEYRGYTGDVTRTIPADGTFTEEQRLIYDIVYEAQEAGINAAVVGNSFRDPGFAAREVIANRLMELGLIKNKRQSFIYFPHGTSHYLGLDVHDAGTYGELQENMVITVEPGIYIPEGSDCDPKWHGIAVRIEDDILITKNGPVNLSAAAPRTSKAVEEMMKKKSALDNFKLPKID